MDKNIESLYDQIMRIKPERTPFIYPSRWTRFKRWLQVFVKTGRIRQAKPAVFHEWQKEDLSPAKTVKGSVQIYEDSFAEELRKHEDG